MNQLYKCPCDNYILLDIPAPLPVIKLPAATAETCRTCKYYGTETAYLPETGDTHLLCACEWEHCKYLTIAGHRQEQTGIKPVSEPEPQTPIRPAQENTQTAEKQEPEPERTPRKVEWTDAEDRAICIAKRGEVAVEYYRRKFPDSDRTDKAILNRWSKQIRAGKSLACGAKARILKAGHGDYGKTGYIKNHSPDRTQALIETEDHANTWFDLTDLEGVNL